MAQQRYAKREHDFLPSLASKLWTAALPPEDLEGFKTNPIRLLLRQAQLMGGQAMEPAVEQSQETSLQSISAAVCSMEKFVRGLEVLLMHM